MRHWQSDSASHDKRCTCGEVKVYGLADALSGRSARHFHVQRKRCPRGSVHYTRAQRLWCRTTHVQRGKLSPQTWTKGSGQCCEMLEHAKPLVVKDRAAGTAAAAEAEAPTSPTGCGKTVSGGATTGAARNTRSTVADPDPRSPFAGGERGPALSKPSATSQVYETPGVTGRELNWPAVQPFSRGAGRRHGCPV